METKKLIEVEFQGQAAEDLRKVLELFAGSYDELRGIDPADLLLFLYEGSKKAGHRIKNSLEQNTGNGGAVYRQIRQYAGHKPSCEQLIIVPGDPETHLPRLYLRDFRNAGGWAEWLAICDFSSQPLSKGKLFELAEKQSLWKNSGVYFYNEPKWA